MNAPQRHPVQAAPSLRATFRTSGPLPREWSALCADKAEARLIAATSGAKVIRTRPIADNRAKLAAFVATTIAQANDRPDGAAHIARNVAKLEGYSAALSGPGAVPAHLVGVSAFDLTAAICELVGAAGERRAA